MYFKCDTSAITAPQLAAITAIATLFEEQNMKAVVLSIDPIMFETKAQLSGSMLKRLVIDRIPLVVPGYAGSMMENTLVISNENAQPAQRSRKRAS